MSHLSSSRSFHTVTGDCSCLVIIIIVIIIIIIKASLYVSGIGRVEEGGRVGGRKRGEGGREGGEREREFTFGNIYETIYIFTLKLLFTLAAQQVEKALG